MPSRSLRSRGDASAAPVAIAGAAAGAGGQSPAPLMSSSGSAAPVVGALKGQAPGCDAADVAKSEELIRQLAVTPTVAMDAAQPQKRAWQAAFQLMESKSLAPEQPLKAMRQRQRAAAGAAGGGAFAAKTKNKKKTKIMHQFCTPLQFNDAARADPSGGTAFAMSAAEKVVTSYVDMVSRRFYDRPDESDLGLALAGTDAPSGNQRLATLGKYFSPTVVGGLMNPVREHSIVDGWSPAEIAKFEGGICLFGKRFHKLQKLIKTKTCKEIVEFYYHWKSTPNYKAWKKSYVPIKM